MIYVIYVAVEDGCGSLLANAYYGPFSSLSKNFQEFSSIFKHFQVFSSCFKPFQSLIILTALAHSLSTTLPPPDCSLLSPFMPIPAATLHSCHSCGAFLKYLATAVLTYTALYLQLPRPGHVEWAAFAFCQPGTYAHTNTSQHLHTFHPNQYLFLIRQSCTNLYGLWIYNIFSDFVIF